MPVVDRINGLPRPRNDGSARIARSAIDQITPVAVQQQLNALAVDGIPCYYFIRKTSGTVCTCSGLQTQTNPDGSNANVMPTTPGSHTVSPQGFGSEEFMASMLEGTTYKINRYGSRPLHLDANGNDNKWRAQPKGRFSNDGVIRAADQSDPFARQIDPITGDAGGDVDTSDLFETAVSQNVNAAAAVTSCAVCLGTGFVGGYDAVNASRIVYDTQANWNAGVILDATQYPAAFNVSGSASLQITIPMGARALSVCRVWNNKDQVTGVTVNVYSKGNWIPLTPNLNGVTKGMPCTLQLVFAPGSTTQITHLELMYDMGLEPVLIGWNRMSFSEDFAKIDQLDDVSVVIPPNVPITSLYDVISEPIYQRTWKVTNTSNAMDRDLKVNGSEASVRVLQPMELVHLLPRMVNAQYFRRDNIVHRRAPHPGENASPDPYTIEQTRFKY